MKIALCFSGQPRFVSDCSNSILANVIGDHDVDVYAHFCWHPSYANEVFRFESEDRYPEDPLKEFLNIYDPKGYHIEKQWDVDLSLYNCIPNDVCDDQLAVRKCFYCQLCMWESIRRCWKIIDDPDSYDVIIRSRTDLTFDQPINWEQWDYNSNLYIADGVKQAGVGREYTDWFAWGGPKAMWRYSNIIDKYEEYMRNGIRHMHDFVEDTTRSLGVHATTVDIGCWLYRNFEKPTSVGEQKERPYYAKEW